MDDKTELCELLYDALLETSAHLHDGLPMLAYMRLMLCLHQAETMFHYTRPIWRSSGRI